MTAFRHHMKRASGYTIVEVMVTVAVATLGFIAIVDLQSSSLRGLANARNTTIAVHQAEHFIEMVRAETLQCTPSTSSLDPECAYLPVEGGADGFRVFGTTADNCWALPNNELPSSNRYGALRYDYESGD